MSKSTDLYRYFDAEDRLLYVGISYSAALRAFDHNGKLWWPLVVRSTIEHFTSRDAALAAETKAIRIEHPLFNIQHRKGRMQTGPQPSKPNADPVLSVRIPVWMKDAVIKVANQDGITPALFIRKALEDFCTLKKS